MKKTKNRPSVEQSGQKEVSNRAVWKSSGSGLCEVIKLGVDVHSFKFVVVRMMDAQNPQPPQSFKPEEFLVWVRKQQSLAREVHAVYEAGPFGYGLYRTLRSMGVIAHVIQPQIWDERKRFRKTDAADAKEMVIRLDRYVAGNKQALNLVRVPSEEEEILRNAPRVRDALKKEHGRVEALGRTLLLYYGIRSEVGKWWKPEPLKGLKERLDPRLWSILVSYHAVLMVVRRQLLETTRQLQSSAPRKELPVGMGALSEQYLDREVCDWGRFKRGRQVGSYTGLCPSEHSTGERQRQGRVNKCGNRLLRAILLEMAWRMVRFQPDYAPVKWFKEAVLKRGPGFRKKAIVAVARRLAVDIWKMKTGRITAEELNLRVGFPCEGFSRIVRDLMNCPA